MTAFTFRPAKSFTERHGLFVALVAPTNAGKTFSGLRLARGIAGPNGKVAVLDTEGGRTLHLKEHFDFDVMLMEPPHRPERYLEAAKGAQEVGYDALLIDSFSMEWRGVGGVLDWMDDELEAAVVRQRAAAEQKGWRFDEDRARYTNKMAASIRPKMAHKLMVAGFLGLRIPVIFSIRGETTLDPETKKEKFKAQCAPNFLFEVTVSFRLASDRKGIIDLSDPTAWKMEKAHQAIFRDGDQLSEEHGAKLAAWARGESVAPVEFTITGRDGKERRTTDIEQWSDAWRKVLAQMQQAGDQELVRRLQDTNRAHFDAARQHQPAAVAEVEALIRKVLGEPEAETALETRGDKPDPSA